MVVRPPLLSSQNFAGALVFLVILGVCVFLLQMAVAVAYDYGVVVNLLAVSSTALEIAFLLSVLLYMRLYKGMGWGDVTSKLGLGRKSLSLSRIGLGALVFLAILALELVVSLASNVTNITINTNTALVLASQPLWFYLVSVIVTPVCEEVLFRAFMVPRLGIVISAVIFGLSHASYDSTFGVDIIAAFIFALVAGYVFRKTKSLYPSIVGHALVNLLAVVPFLS